MDLSWCIMCDCHCIEDSLYCSESCRAEDNNYNIIKVVTSREPSPPSSPLLEPFLSFFNYGRRTSLTMSSRASLNEHNVHIARR